MVSKEESRACDSPDIYKHDVVCLSSCRSTVYLVRVLDSIVGSQGGNGVHLELKGGNKRGLESCGRGAGGRDRHTRDTLDSFARAAASSMALRCRAVYEGGTAARGGAQRVSGGKEKRGVHCTTAYR